MDKNLFRIRYFTANDIDWDSCPSDDCDYVLISENEGEFFTVIELSEKDSRDIAVYLAAILDTDYESLLLYPRRNGPHYVAIKPRGSKLGDLEELYSCDFFVLENVLIHPRLQRSG